jgi:hypothetical protein
LPELEQNAEELLAVVSVAVASEDGPEAAFGVAAAVASPDVAEPAAADAASAAEAVCWLDLEPELASSDGTLAG